MSRVEIQKVSASHGWLWIQHGYRLIMRSPLQAFSLAMTFALGLFVAMLIPVAGVLFAVLLMPVMMAGYMRACRALEFNEPVFPRYSFAGFQSRTAQLVAVGGILLAGMMAVSMVVAGMGGEALNAILSVYKDNQDPTALIDAILAPESGLHMTMLVGFILFFLLMLALQFAPMLVFFDGATPREALAMSLVASFKNIVPFSVYSLIMQLIAFAVSVIPFGLGWIILVPIGLTSMYVAYRDIFSEVKEVDVVNAVE
jgi:uncharacterized membrane protein